MRDLLAHQGGWDEILLPGLLVLGYFTFVARRRKRRAAEDQPAGVNGACHYCGQALDADERRCSACGFRRVMG